MSVFQCIHFGLRRFLFFLPLELIIPIQFIARVAILKQNLAIDPADQIFGKGNAVFCIVYTKSIQDGLELFPPRQEGS